MCEIELVFEEDNEFKTFCDKHKQKQIKKNINQFKKEISEEELDKKLHKKLTNYLKENCIENKKVNQLIKEILKDIDNNGILFLHFIKKFSKQNLYEKYQQLYLYEHKINLTKPEKQVRLYKGNFVYGSKSRIDHTKSIDFQDDIKDKMIYISAKYIREKVGGSQDNQFTDLCKFVKESVKILDNKEYFNKYLFVCLVDGDYFTDVKIKNLEELIVRHKDSIKILKTTDYINFKQTY